MPYETGNNGVCNINSNSNFNAKVYKWLTKLPAAAFNTTSSKVTFLVFRANNYKILGIKCVRPKSNRWKMFFKMAQKACNFFKKRPRRRCFPVKFAKCLRRPYLQSTSGGCFCRQNRSKETKIYYSTMAWLYGYFCWSIMTQRNRSNCKIWRKCSLIMKYYNSQFMKKLVGKT